MLKSSPLLCEHGNDVNSPNPKGSVQFLPGCCIRALHHAAEFYVGKVSERAPVPLPQASDCPTTARLLVVVASSHVPFFSVRWTPSLDPFSWASRCSSSLATSTTTHSGTLPHPRFILLDFAVTWSITCHSNLVDLQSNQHRLLMRVSAHVCRMRRSNRGRTGEPWVGGAWWPWTVWWSSPSQFWELGSVLGQA